MTDATTATTPEATIVSRPTTKSEWTLIGALGASCVLVLLFGGVLAFKHWPDFVLHDIVHFLGWTLIMLAGGILLVIIAVISPSVGTVKAHVLGSELEINGKTDA